MITNDTKEFENSENFAMQVISRGGFIDNGGAGNGKKYCVETINLRANVKMLEKYIRSSLFNARETYSTQKEWESYRRAKEVHRAAWNERVKQDLMSLIPNIYDGSCFIQKVQSEVFTLVHIFETAE
jgi:hypothetical protein